MSKIKIIIVACAMQEEYRQAYKAIVGRDYEGNFGESSEFVGDKLFSFNLIGIGKAQAAMNLTRVLCIMKERNYYNVTHVINVGFAAGTIDSNLGDVFIASKVYQHDLSIPDEFSEALKQNIWQDANLPYCLNYRAYCASGDKFVNKEDVESIIEVDKNIKCFDMESAAVCRVSHFYNVKPIIIKVISDIPQDEEKSGVDAFFKMYHQDTQKYFSILKKIVELI